MNLDLEVKNMRDTKRIYKFCNELADVWCKAVPDWRFGQLMVNIFRQMAVDKRDPFFPEEEEMMKIIKNYLGVKD